MKLMTSIGQSIEALCSEQGFDRELVIEAMKEAVKAAARKQFKAQDKTGESIEVEWNNEEGMVEISAHKTVVAGSRKSFNRTFSRRSNRNDRRR